MTYKPLLDASWAGLATPASIALVGASERLTGVSFTDRFLANNRQLGYTGSIHLINPHRKTIFDIPAAPSVSSLDTCPDAVIVNVPAALVEDVVHESIAAGCRSLMIHSGGFAEAGDDGRARQQALHRACDENGVGLIGPNCLGLVSLIGSSSLYGSPLPPGLKRGPIAAITQSGSVASSFLSVTEPYGLSFLASTGNEAVTTTEDLLERAVDDPSTEFIVMFIETLRQPARFMQIARRAAEQGKAMVALKVGRTESGGRVSRGHTGAVTGSGEVYRQALAQCGVIEVLDFDELEQTVRLLMRSTRPAQGGRLAILGTSGGKLASVADTASELGMTLADFSPETVTAVKQALSLPDGIATANPLDVGTGFRSTKPYGQRFQECIRAVSADPAVDLVAVMQDLSTGLAGSLSLNDDIIEAAISEASVMNKPLVIFTCHAQTSNPTPLIDEAPVPILQGGRASLRAIQHFCSPSRVAQESQSDGVRLTSAVRTVDRPTSMRPTVSEAFRLLRDAGLPMIAYTAVTSEEQATVAFANAGAPAVMKVDAPTHIHKSDIGGVVTGISSATEAREAFRRLIRIPIEGGARGSVVVCPQLVGGTELYVGVRADRDFGLVTAFGLGGRLVEFLSRTALAVGALDHDSARELIDRSGVTPLLTGYRGGAKADIGALADTVVTMTQVAAGFGDTLEAVELNPIIITAEHRGGCVVDARLLLKEWNADE